MNRYLSRHAAVLALAGTALSCQPATPPAEEPAASSLPLPVTRKIPTPSTPHWSYEGETAPATWGSLSPEFSACAEGRSQSPIDITNPRSETLPEVAASFGPASLRIVHHEHMADAINNGHTIQVNYPDGDTLTVGDRSFELLQYHFHAPSEHTLDGRHFPMEMHMVHKATDGALAVLGVFIEEGGHDAAFDPIWANLPSEKGVESHYEGIQVNVDDLLPKSRTTYRYDGSLTTPPCSEGVTWLLLTESIQLSSDQIGAFTALVHDNNRPVQPLNERVLVADRIGGQS